MNDQTVTGPVGERAYWLMRSMIMRNQLRPGATVDEIGLASTLKLSRTPVREALIRLAAEGLVFREGRNMRVATVDVMDIQPLFEALEFLSRAINRLAAINRSDNDLKVIESAMNRFENNLAGDGEMLSDANHDFHQAIGRAAGNDYIFAGYQRALSASIQLAAFCFGGLNDYSDRDADHNATTVSQHLDIFNAIAEQDAEEAERLAMVHTRLFQDRVLRVFQTDERKLRVVGFSGGTQV